jgi:ParB family chromosome partitioning protein
MPDIELKNLQPNRLNPRLEFNKSGLDELADSIKQVGVLEPIIVRPKDGHYEVVVGERRYRAAQQAGLDKVPVTIHDYTDDEVLQLNLIENIQREDLSAIEKAKVCKQLIEKFGDKFPSQEKVGERIGVTQSAIAEWMSTLKLPEEIQRQVAPRTIQQKIPEGKISYKTATNIARVIKEPNKQIEIAEKLAKQHIPTRAAQVVIKEFAKKPDKSIEQVFREVVTDAPIFLPFSKHHADAILKQIKTQTSRKTKDPRLQPGVIVRAQITHFADLEIANVYRKKLGDFDEEDARREGGYTLDEFKKIWKSLHGDWNPNEIVYVIKFRLKKVIGEPSNDSG